MSPANLAFLVVGLALYVAPTTAKAGEINTCKYLLVQSFSNDPYGIAQELRAQAIEKGFAVPTFATDVPPNELLKLCVMTGSWSVNGFGGQLSMQVVDSSGAFIADAAARATAGINATRIVRGTVAKIYSKLGYTGFNENLYQMRLLREYPQRPTFATSEESITKSEPQNPLEGIWTDTDDKYRLGVVRAPEGSGADYFAVILRSNSPIWQVGEIKAEIRNTAAPEVFTCTYYMANKKPIGTTVTLEHKALLRGSAVNTSTGPFTLSLVRVWPKIMEEPSSQGSKKSVATGTGFLLNRGGLVATNWHVVADAKNITVAFSGWNEDINAQVVLKDKVNDLALLRVGDSSKLRTTCGEFPFQLASASNVQLGERVSTVGYPLTSILGSNPKFAEGVIASKSGIQEDPRALQISAQVQPGSSGSPLFDSDGNIIGIVVATLDALKVYQTASAIPQNVNFAIKSDYLMSLLAMLPTDDAAALRMTPFSPEKASKCVALIQAW